MNPTATRRICLLALAKWQVTKRLNKENKVIRNKNAAPLLPRTILTAMVLPALLLTGCGSKFSTQRSVEKGTPVQVIEPPAPPAPVEPARPAIEPTATVPPSEPLRSLPAAISLRDQAARASAANDHSRAIGLLLRALRVSPDDPQTYYDLASSHLKLNQPREALQIARRGLSLNPTNTQRESLERLVARSEATL